MNEREQLILECLIGEYIKNGKPVGSQELLKRCETLLKCSSATIRTHLNSLAQKGYLTQQHISSGRVPTNQAYRFYVDEVVKITDMIDCDYQDEYVNVDWTESNLHILLDQLQQSLLSFLDYTVIVITPSIMNERIKDIQFIQTGVDHILVIITGVLGMKEKMLIDTHHSLTQEDLTHLSRQMTMMYQNKSLLSLLNKTQRAHLINQPASIKKVVSALALKIKRYIESTQSQNTIRVKGKSNMLKMPDFSNVSYVRQVIDYLEGTDVFKVLNIALKNNRCEVVIGEESGVRVLDKCSMVMSPFYYKSTAIGSVNILGPTRMNYLMVVPFLNKMSQRVTDYASQSGQHLF